MLASVQLRMGNRSLRTVSFGCDIPMRLTAAEGGCFFPFPFFEAIATELISRSILRRVKQLFQNPRVCAEFVEPRFGSVDGFIYF